jgi:hypothetical protein
MTAAGRHARVVASNELCPPDELCPPTGHEAGCITCGDTASSMRVVEVDRARALAVCVDARGHRHMVDTGIVESVAPGDTLLVHAGTALAREPV